MSAQWPPKRPSQPPPPVRQTSESTEQAPVVSTENNVTESDTPSLSSLPVPRRKPMPPPRKAPAAPVRLTPTPPLTPPPGAGERLTPTPPPRPAPSRVSPAPPRATPRAGAAGAPATAAAAAAAAVRPVPAAPPRPQPQPSVEAAQRISICPPQQPPVRAAAVPGSARTSPVLPPQRPRRSSDPSAPRFSLSLQDRPVPAPPPRRKPAAPPRKTPHEDGGFDATTESTTSSTGTTTTAAVHAGVQSTVPCTAKFDLSRLNQRLQQQQQQQQQQHTGSESSSPLPDSGRKLGPRDHAAVEILTTERTFCKTLRDMVESVIRPVNQWIDAEGDPKAVEGCAQCRALGSAAVTLVRLNERFLQDLERRLVEWFDQDLPPESPERGKRKKMGDLLVEFAPFFSMYSQYSALHGPASEWLVEQMEKGPARLRQIGSDAEQRTLQTVSSMLIAPIQRVPRYRLLFEQLLKHTPPEDPDHAVLSEALEKVHKAASHINEEIRKFENARQMRELAAMFTSDQADLVSPSRRFLRRGMLTKVCRDKDEQYEFLLFSDLLCYASASKTRRNKLQMHRKIPIDAVFAVRDVRDDEASHPHTIMVVNSVKTFAVYAQTEAELGMWKSDFQQVLQERDQQLAARSAAGVDTAVDGTAAAPMFLSSKATRECEICAQKFGFRVTRRTCKLCGRVVCSACSRTRRSIARLSEGSGAKKTHRICDVCEQRLQHGASMDELARESIALGMALNKQRKEAAGVSPSPAPTPTGSTSQAHSPAQPVSRPPPSAEERARASSMATPGKLQTNPVVMAQLAKLMQQNIVKRQQQLQE
ncbi:MAG: hypothetical protein MHM6MM_001666 [Cercozoa sp. M6MM]